jgi:hypothetical protein
LSFKIHDTTIFLASFLALNLLPGLHRLYFQLPARHPGELEGRSPKEIIFFLTIQSQDLKSFPFLSFLSLEERREVC